MVEADDWWNGGRPSLDSFAGPERGWGVVGTLPPPASLIVR